MATIQPQRDVGSLLREWRQRRRMTQLELALEAEISARHLSFVETGRSLPGRELLLKVLERLQVPSLVRQFRHPVRGDELGDRDRAALPGRSGDRRGAAP